ncbi:MCE family protein [Nocardia huaxiensis]|uniref:MCE family protein n=1 Tax=Nocardia huaxiensis TaxID=2755382 RepID=A0A7D6V7Q4_9NOCA|nr:MCE family protein [Nocardia huaxiensis]QLY27682.1 MCE family protein [Nocardia huaxiensis]UFS98929.1 MCE family protein [Nocardia huaxiensis]
MLSNGKPWRKAALAAGVTAAVVATGVAGVTWANSASAADQQVCAEFKDTVGLYEGNSVTMLGVDIGTVSKIEALGDRMRVTMSIASKYTLPADVTAVTMSSSIVTDRHVELANPYTGGDRFDTAKCIPLERTKTPIGISEALDAMGVLAEDLTVGGGANGQPDLLLDSTLTAANQAMSGTGQQFNQLLQRLSAVVGDPSQRDVVFRRLVDNLDQLTTMFVSNWPDMQLVLDNLRVGLQLIGEFSMEFAGAVDIAVEFLPVIARNAGKYDQRVFELLDQILPQAKQVLETHQGSISDLLAQLPPLVNQLPQGGAR